ncbi:MAG: SsrA-binding protein SmpB [Planctomycetes bacterium]|nr:SsrA-binding protein SmpB [Planctomycetota bacterium]
MTKRATDVRPVCQNKKALARFELLERLECGIMLLGTEVKSLRTQASSLDEAYARFERGELWLIGFHIGAYKFGHTGGHDPRRQRKLLLHARELRKLRPRLEIKGLTLVPLRVYFNERGLAKVTVALARGKNVRDRREDLKAKDHQREMDRATRRRR